MCQYATTFDQPYQINQEMPVESFVRHQESDGLWLTSDAFRVELEQPQYQTVRLARWSRLIGLVAMVEIQIAVMSPVIRLWLLSAIYFTQPEGMTGHVAFGT